jgi:hypothetical protein
MLMTWLLSVSRSMRAAQVSVLEKGTPVAEAQIGSDQRRFFAMAFVHQGEEKTHLNRFNLYVANFVY